MIWLYLVQASFGQASCVVSYVVVHQVGMCVVDTIVQDADDDAFSREAALPHADHVHVVARRSSGLTKVVLQSQRNA